MGEIRVQDEQGTVHVFPDGSTPEMIAQALNVKAPSSVNTQPEAHGIVRRFTERFLGLPDDIFDNPGAYLNPFGKAYWDRAAQQRAASDADPNGIKALNSAMDAIGSPKELSFYVPGHRQTLEDLKSGNIAGAIGDVAPTALAVAQAAAPAAKAMGPALGKAASFAGDVIDPDITGLVSPRLAHLQRTLGRIGARLNDPQMQLFRSTPKIGEIPSGDTTSSTQQQAATVGAGTFNSPTRPVNKTFDLLDQKLAEVHNLMDEAGMPKLEGDEPSAPPFKDAGSNSPPGRVPPRSTLFGPTDTRPAVRSTVASGNVPAEPESLVPQLQHMILAKQVLGPKATMKEVADLARQMAAGGK